MGSGKAARRVMIAVTPGGWLLAWTLYRDGAAAKHLRENLDATLRPDAWRRAGWVTT
jgi:hypothetical protein